ncbi:MAG: ABC transporter permease [Chloroflexota bacterium]|nr:ABC transporter permease [Chloroflexota bacterium]
MSSSLRDAARTSAEASVPTQRIVPRASRAALSSLLAPSVLFPAGMLLVFIVAWELFARTTDPVLFPRPLRVLGAYDDLIRSGDLPRAFLTTMQTLTIGFLLSAVVGIVGGIVIGRIPLVGAVLDPYIEAIYATPRVVITPLVVLWFGVGDVGRLFLVFIGTFIPILINTAIGVRNARPDLVEVGRAFGASGHQLVRHVILPGSVPYVIAGLRIGIGRALIGVVIAEIFLDLTGLGGLIQTDVSYFRVDRMIAVVLVLALIGTVLMAVMGKLEARFSTWR